MRYYIAIALIFITVAAKAQTVSGIVTDGETGKPLSPVTVTNLTTNSFAFTDEQGKYNILAKKGNELAFSFIGYKSIKQTIISNSQAITLNVLLHASSYQLKEFVVHPGNLTPFQRDSLERAIMYRSALNKTRPDPINSPLSALADRFSERSKDVYRFQKSYKYFEAQRFIDTRYTPDLVSSLTGLTGDTAASFMNTYPMQDDFARAATDLELKMWIRTNYKAWVKDSGWLKVPKIQAMDRVKNR